MPDVLPEAGVIYVGCKEAKEISLTRRGSNPLSFALVTKNADAVNAVGKAAPTTQPETADMATEAAETTKTDAKAVAKAVAALASMCDVTKAHFLTLGEDAQAAFLEKTADERKAEADAAKKAKDDVAEADAAKAAGLTQREAAMQKSLDEQRAEIDAMKAKEADRDLQDRAAHKDFNGFPGGVDEVKKQLKVISKLSDEDQAPIIDTMKSRAAMARKMADSGIGSREENDALKGVSREATKKINAAATEKSQKEGVSFAVAYRALSEDKNWANDFAQARDEEHAASAAAAGSGW